MNEHVFAFILVKIRGTKGTISEVNMLEKLGQIQMGKPNTTFYSLFVC